MERLFEISGGYRDWLPGVGLLVAAALLGVLWRSIFYRQAKKLAARTETKLDDILLTSTRRWWPWWFVFVALVPAVHLTPLAVSSRGLVYRFAMVAIVLTLSFAASRFVGLWFDSRAEGEGAFAKPSLMREMTRIAVLVAGALLVLDNLGIEITPLLTALGVGSLAVALALQPTLSNLFAGLHMSVARPIRVGDYIELEGGTQGWVEDIGWRATRLRQMPNNIVIVPNAKLADMVLKNYEMPGTEQSAVVTMGVAYDSDLERVERIVIEVAREVLQTVEGGVPEFEPLVRFHTFGDSSINFNVILRARHVADRFLPIHEFVKRVKARFDAEGIEIPFPQRVVHLPGAQEKPLEEPKA
ncbi:MAG: mechanosensitive ion channel family protein [Acidobacteria bacterium]|nr:mechanosensitive ion channel family protein [Acidobacteriota bacterium]